MNNVLNDVLVGVAEPIANLQLPDPNLRDYYRDEEDRIFWIDSEIDASTLELVRMIMRCNREDKGKPVEERKPITVFIDSPGGSVEVLYTLVKAMKASKTIIRTVNYCTCFSAASEILAAGTKGYRYCMPGSMVMCHVGSMQIGGTMGNVEATKKFCDELCKKCTDIFLENTNIDAKLWKKKTGSNSDWYLFEDEALNCGIVDHIISDYDELF